MDRKNFIEERRKYASIRISTLIQASWRCCHAVFASWYLSNSFVILTYLFPNFGLFVYFKPQNFYSVAVSRYKSIAGVYSPNLST